MKLSILFSSYAQAYDIWHITEYFFNKYWKDCPFEIFLGANGENKKEYCPKNWCYINRGEDKSFSQSLLSYLEDIEVSYFILMLDDFILLDRVDIINIEKAFDFIEKNSGVYLRLVPNPKGDKKINKDFSMIDVDSSVPYITSLQMAIWKKDFLIELLKYDFSPWEFETKAGKTKEALKNSKSFFVTNKPFIKYTHYVEKGRFYPFIKEVLEKEKLKLKSTREFWTKDELKKISNLRLKDSIRNLIPNKYINKIRKIIGKEVL